MIKIRRRMKSILAVGIFMVASGCAGKGVAPDEQMAATERIINQAKFRNATVYAPLELKLADEKLKSAKAASEAENYDLARQLLSEAQAEANLAMAKSESAKTRQLVKELQESIETLKNEVERNQ